MAVQHIAINSSSPNGGRLRIALDNFFSGLRELRVVAAAMPGMVDGSDHTYLEEQFGLDEGDGTTLKNELEATLFHINPESTPGLAIQQLQNWAL